MPPTEEDYIRRNSAVGFLFFFSGPESLMTAWLNYYNSVNNTNLIVPDNRGSETPVVVDYSLSIDEMTRQAREHMLPLMKMVNGAGFEVRFRQATWTFPPRHYEISGAEQERVDLGKWLTNPLKVDSFLEINRIYYSNQARESASGFLSPELRAFARMVGGERVPRSEIYTRRLLRNMTNEISEEVARYIYALQGNYFLGGNVEDREDRLKSMVREAPPLKEPAFYMHPFMKVVAERVFARLFLGQKPLDLYDQPPEIRTATAPESQSEAM